MTSPYFENIDRMSVSVTLKGNPPRNILGYCAFFFDLIAAFVLHGFGSIYKTESQYTTPINASNEIETLLTARPSNKCVVLANTFSTQFGSLNVTKPNPLDWPLSVFFITIESITSPNSLKYSCSFSTKNNSTWQLSDIYRLNFSLNLPSVVSQLRPPTNNFLHEEIEI